MTAVVLSSGGLDSFLAWTLSPNATNVFVDIGHKYQEKERAALEKLSAGIPAMEVIWTSGAPMGNLELPSGIIPMRNAELIIAASHHGTEIVLGILADEINSDKSVAFLKAMELALNESWLPQYWNDDCGRTFTIYSPLRHLTKSEAVASYLQAGGSSESLLLTVSCYDSAELHCGRCPSCFKRWVALVNNDLPCDFASNPIKWAGATDIIQKAKDGTYAPRRANEILEAICK